MGRYDVKTRILRALCLFLAVAALASLFALPCSAAVSFRNELDTYAQSVFMQSIDTGETVYEKASLVRRSPASLTKIMTALLVIESCEDPEKETVTVPNNQMFDEIRAVGGVNIALQEGETISVKDLLYAIMLPSACDAAELLAWHFGKGNVNNFVNAMNARAQGLGLENTHFGNPHGLEATLHYSCAADIAVILSEAMKHPLFREIISTLSYTIPATNKKDARTIQYTIAMLSPGSSYYYEGMLGVKSGYTGPAGRCLATTATRNGMSYLLVVMGANLDPDQATQNKNLAYDDTKALYDYAFNNFQLNEAVKAGESYHTLTVENGQQSTVNLVAKKSTSLLCYKNAQLSYKIEAPERVQAPVSTETVGKLKIYFGEECLAEVELVPENAVAAVATTVTNKPSPYTGSAHGNILTNDPVTVILLLSLAVIVLLTVLLTTLVRLAKNTRKR